MRRTPIEDAGERGQAVPAASRRGAILLSAALVALVAVAVGLELHSIQELRVAGAAGATVRKPTVRVPVTPSSIGPRIAIIGDDSRSVSGVDEAERWPTAVARALDGELVQWTVPKDAYTGAHGYLTSVAALPSSADVVIVSGGTADRGASRLELVKRATEVFSIARRRAPRAALVVVGPLPPAHGGSDALRSVRETLQSAAVIAGARFVDPISAHWLDRAERGMKTASSRRSAQAAIANRLGAQVRGAIRTAVPMR